MKIVTYSRWRTSCELTYFTRKHKSYRPNSIWQPGFKGALPSDMVTYSSVWGEDYCLQRAGTLYMYVRGGEKTYPVLAVLELELYKISYTFLIYFLIT
jgi:hypothetical protein